MALGFPAILMGVLLLALIVWAIRAATSGRPQRSTGWGALIAVLAVCLMGGAMLLLGFRAAPRGTPGAVAMVNGEYTSDENAAFERIQLAIAQAGAYLPESRTPRDVVVECTPANAVDDAALSRIATRLRRIDRRHLVRRGDAPTTGNAIAVKLEFLNDPEGRRLLSWYTPVKDGAAIHTRPLPDVFISTSVRGDDSIAVERTEQAAPIRSPRDSAAPAAGIGSKGVAGWVRQLIAAGAFAVLLLLAYLFLDAGTRGHYTGRLRIGAAAAFFAVCLLLWRFGSFP